MREDQKMAIIKLLKPDIAKISLFLILAFFISILPIYPSHVDRYNGFTVDVMDEYDSSFIAYQSFSTVLYNDYNWTEPEFTPYSAFVPNDELLRHYTKDYVDADPSFMIVYVPLFFFGYLASCYYVEQERYDRKNRRSV